MMAAAVLTSFNSVLNSSATLYVCDLHETYIDENPKVHRLNTLISLIFCVASALAINRIVFNRVAVPGPARQA